MAEYTRRKVILITDGDDVAARTIQKVAQDIGGRCISRSSGNPTPLTGEALVRLILKAKYDPVLVMFDDNGEEGVGNGEQALQYVARHPQICVLGALAVASNTDMVYGTPVDLAIDGHGKMMIQGVDKDGHVDSRLARIYGDTVDVLAGLDIPLIIGIGDIGKMNGKDHIRYGSPITRKAVNMILERSGII